MRHTFLILIFLFPTFILFGQSKNCNAIYHSGVSCLLVPIVKINDTIITTVPTDCNNLFFDSKANGQWKIFSADTTILKEIIGLKNGQYDGVDIKFYHTGQVKSRAIYNDGKLNGDYISYFESGKIESKGYYQNERFSGTSFKYWDNGNMALREIQNDSTYFGQDMKFWDKDGNSIDFKTYQKLWYDCE